MKNVIINSITGERTEEELSQEILDLLENDKLKFQIEKAEAEAKAIAKAELLAKLGITADEAALLLS